MKKSLARTFCVKYDQNYVGSEEQTLQGRKNLAGKTLCLKPGFNPTYLGRRKGIDRWLAWVGIQSDILSKRYRKEPYMYSI
jgi:hypothetical protein